MYRYLMSIVLGALLLLLLAACEGGMAAEDAEEGLRAALSGDLEKAEQYFCDLEMDELRSGLDLSTSFDSIEVDCAADGGDMECRISSTNADGSQTSITQRFNVEDGKLCGEG